MYHSVRSVNFYTQLPSYSHFWKTTDGKNPPVSSWFYPPLPRELPHPIELSRGYPWQLICYLVPTLGYLRSIFSDPRGGRLIWQGARLMCRFPLQSSRGRLFTVLCIPCPPKLESGLGLATGQSGGGGMRIIPHRRFEIYALFLKSGVGDNFSHRIHAHTHMSEVRAAPRGFDFDPQKILKSKFIKRSEASQQALS